ncbi:hypothetical protein [Candidatus Palauibacter irciniicola]|uniref:hypothetical protein n=1 Tax=Candidatus Palauibacter irciniicola TaxID=3056733 RepID=UPI003B01BCAE
MYTGVGGEEHACTIAGHRRTRIFEFPRIDLRLDEDEPHHFIYDTPPIHACITADLVGYFECMTRSTHYAISPSLRHEASTTAEKVKGQKGERLPVFLVMEEHNELVPVEMINGECSIMDEMFERDGKREPALVGGREGHRFITAWPTVDGAWPQLPNHHTLVNLILAAVRVAQQTSDPIRKYVDHGCLVTEDGQFVVMMPPARFSARATTSMPMDAAAFKGIAAEIRQAITVMEPDLAIPHMALLVNSMYSDEHKDDAYKRLEYLRLWQSLEETARKLGYRGEVKRDKVAVGAKKTLRELKDYRDDIAHWWTDNLDENFLADLRRTINELVARKYF